jgi:hypothetical protein
MHDVFISHRNENKDWVMALADNLKRCGLDVWLDMADLNPGEPMARQKREALQNSLHGILLATPEALESNWVQDDYDALLARRSVNPDFHIIPLFFGAFPRFPFLESRFCVDFSDPAPEAYRAALRQVLRSLRNQPPGDPVDLPADLQIPLPLTPRLHDMAARPLGQSEEDFVAGLFEILRENHPVMLLSQADRCKTAAHRAILAQARRRFGPDNALHLVPLGPADLDRGEYFTYLGRQIDPGRSCIKASDFEFLMEDCLARGKSMFLLMTRLEEGSQDGRQALSRALRNLSERYSDWLKIVLCGSERLLELRFKEGHLSPLRNATTLLWPEPTVADILSWQPPETGSLTAEEASVVLRLTGGNVRLIDQALKMLRPGVPLNMPAVAEKLRQDPLLRSRFAACREHGDGERVASLLKRDDLGRYEQWPIQTLLRRLYWDGLLAERQGRFRWRCELIRLVGREVLGC